MALHERRLYFKETRSRAPSLLSSLEDSVVLRELFSDLANYACANAIFLPDLPYPDVDPVPSRGSPERLENVRAVANLSSPRTIKDKTRTRLLYDDYVQRTKALNCGRPPISSAKRRATFLGLSIKSSEAKQLHWSDVQAFPPSILTTSPESADSPGKRPPSMSLR